MFRPEALEHRTRAHAAGSELRIGPRWADKAFWSLLALALAALVAGALIRIDSYVTGPATVAPNGRALVLVPASVAGSLEEGGSVDLGGVDAEIASVGERSLDPEEVERRFGLLVGAPSVVVVTDHEGPLGAVTGRVVSGSEPVLSLVPGLEALFGGDDG